MQRERRGEIRAHELEMRSHVCMNRDRDIFLRLIGSTSCKSLGSSVCFSNRGVLREAIRSKKRDTRHQTWLPERVLYNLKGLYWDY